ncbi:MAG: hypothetical protein U0V87_10870 [Acidobacteriota bacterium]
MSHEVFFILDACFQGDLCKLSRRGHVWLLKSSANEVLARSVWSRETEDHSPERGVTTFDGSEDSLEDFYRFLGKIDLHHGEYSAPKPWDVIHVSGVPFDLVQPNRMAQELGLHAIVSEVEEQGFAIRRAAQQDDAPDGASHRK